jgi:glycosyltransferase involved in cell wall biosynthesis
MKNKVLVLGYFGHFTNKLNGQTVRTRSVYELFKYKNGLFESVTFFDTQMLEHNKLSFLKMVWQVFHCTKLIYLPAQNNLKYIFPIIYPICKLGRVEILYIVVGGWLAKYLETKKMHVTLLSRIRGLFTQTVGLKDELQKKYGLNNVTVFPNFRMHSFVPTFNDSDNGLRIVFMARISRPKGIDAVFRLAKHIEGKPHMAGRIVIDFYGPIDRKDEVYFHTQVDKFKFVSYKGIIEPDQIYCTLEKYDLSLLPTQYPGEGFPGTILDSYISGLPVIVSNWRHLPEFVDQGETGFIFDLNEEKKLYDYVDKLYRDRELLSRMKRNAFEKSKLYSSEGAWQKIKDHVVE